MMNNKLWTAGILMTLVVLSSGCLGTSGEGTEAPAEADNWCANNNHGELVTDGCVAQPSPFSTQVGNYNKENPNANIETGNNLGESPCTGGQVIACDVGQ